MFAIGLIELDATESTLRELNSAYVTQRPTFQSVDENTIAHGQRRFPEVEAMTYHRRDLTGRTYIFGSATGGIGINDRGPVAAVGADRGCEAGVDEAVGVADRGVLAAGIGVMHAAADQVPAPCSHLQRVEHQICAHMTSDLPANNHPRVDVGDERDVEPAFPCRAIGDIGQPQLVRISPM